MPFSYKKLRSKIFIGYFTQIGLGFNLDSIRFHFDKSLNQYIESNLNGPIFIFGSEAEYQPFWSFIDYGLIIGIENTIPWGNEKNPNAGINLLFHLAGNKKYFREN